MVRAYGWGRNGSSRWEDSLTEAGLCYGSRAGGHYGLLMETVRTAVSIHYTNNLKALFYINLTIYPSVFSASSNLFLNGNVFQMLKYQITSYPESDVAAHLVYILGRGRETFDEC